MIVHDTRIEIRMPIHNGIDATADMIDGAIKAMQLEKLIREAIRTEIGLGEETVTIKIHDLIR